MNYQNPKIPSSYQYFNLGKIIYDVVLTHKPLKIIEFGCYKGYSTTAMAMALKQLGRGKIMCYDLWDSYQYTHTTLNDTINNIKPYDVLDFIEFKRMDLYEWLQRPEQFDLLHIDIGNTGDIIKKLYDATKSQIDNGSVILFEGGSIDRDNVDWMLKYNCTPINNIKSDVQYTILTNYFPSLSIIKKYA
jgi:predicted O-methyltransferase YrrM